MARISSCDIPVSGRAVDDTSLCLLSLATCALSSSETKSPVPPVELGLSSVALSCTRTAPISPGSPRQG